MLRSSSSSRGLLVVRLALCALALAALQPSQVVAAQTKAEQACRSAIAKGYGKYVKLAQKAIVSCHRGRDAGNPPPSTDCNDVAVADTAAKAAAAASKAADALASKCAAVPTVIAEFGRCPTPFQLVDDGGITTGVDDAGELAECLEAHATDLVESLAAKILRSPAPPLSPELVACHAALAKSYTKYVDTVIKSRSKCQTTRDKAGESIGFSDCVMDDASGKIELARDKGASAIAAACEDAAAQNLLSRGSGAGPRAIADLGSCATDIAGLQACAFDEVATTGLTALMWELPGICPADGSYIVTPVATGTDLDVGWTGLGHNRDPILGYKAIRFTVACDPDCANCASTSVGTAPEACRCSGNVTLSCTTPGIDPACSGAGSCECYYGPPTPYSAGNIPACVLSRLDGTMTGTLDPSSGNVALSIPLRHKIHLGISLSSPCPLCESGFCIGGARDGSACSVDAADATYGPVSYECPPNIGSNISGSGVYSLVNYTTGTVSLPFGTKCSAPNAALDCACSLCSLDSTVGCNSNADCLAKSAGTCTGASSPRSPNQCANFTHCTNAGGGEGECTGAGETQRTWCDAWTSGNGEGIVQCTDNSDCVNLASECPGGDCGTCSLATNQPCFLNPITATGAPGDTIVGVGCLGQTSNGSVNFVAGFPGAFRVRQHLAFTDLLCSDGVTPFAPPGGSNCPP